jgi:TRAP-type C4-dicarboxylate transport system permease small subunit
MVDSPAPAGVADRIDAALSLISRILAVIAAAAGCGIFVLVVGAVVMRYGLGAPFRFTEELSGLLLAQMVFLAIPLTLTTHINIRVTLLSDLTFGPLRRLIWVIGQAIMVAFGAVFAWESWAITEFTMRLNLRTEQVRLLLSPWMIAVTGAVMLATAIAAWQALRPPPKSSGMAL